ncbi:Ig-like domain-containing protein [Pseudomonas sp. LFM046]|uniref:Ig-like domain-containing protein n=1 Tax=Pseudomonas sp. LFM046 TaxID=1608357 RepID=UPI0005CFA865|nr:Ig-like domain-containing protein [Pseudomonas sp. LFM046]
MFKWPGILTMALGLLAGTPAADAALTAVDPGPYTAASGFFPRWYQDANSVPLELCLSKAVSSRVPGGFMCTLLPNPGIFDTAKPVVFPANFPDESFWMLAETSIDDPGNGLELEAYVAGVEAAFAGGLPLQGDQQSFARIRIRVNVPVAGTYKVTHPYGVETFNVTAPGRRAINLTRDIGIGAPGDFTGALAGNIGPFLTRVGPLYTETNPETGEVETFIGDPNIAEPVTGSPFNTNFIRIDGPNGLRIETNLFNLSGKVLSAGVPSQLGVDRASYSRNAQRTWISVFANSAATATLCFRESLDLVGDPPSPCQFQMTGDGTGRFFGQDVAPTSLPPFVLITAKEEGTTTKATTQSQPLTDVVKISDARYSWSTRTLTVEANSSDEVGPPELVAQGFGRLVPVSGVNQRLVASDVDHPPAKVTVKSAAGGSDTEFVLIEGAPPAPPANQPPVANPDTASTSAGIAVTLDLTANDTDPDGNLPLSIANLGTVTVGTLAQSGNGAVIYTPPTQVAANEVVTFTYQVRDALGALSAPTDVSITVRPNLPPTVAPDTATTNAGAPVVINVLANDVDPEGNAMTVVNVTPPPAGRGSASTNGTTVTYTPPATVPATTTVSFTYQAQDSAGATSTPTTVTVTVNPVVAADTLSITQAQVQARPNNRFSWSFQGTTSQPRGNQIQVLVSGTQGQVLLGTATPSANGRWKLTVNNSTAVVPSANPTVTVRSTLGAVLTGPISVR